MRHSLKRQRATLGIVGFGAFGKLVAHHLREWFDLYAFDPARNVSDYDSEFSVRMAELAKVARCDVVVLAPPVDQFRNAVLATRAHLQPGSLVVDVCSVKLEPTAIMQELLPDFVDIVGTHPLFGPQSARDGIAGLKIAICPVRGSAWRLSAFLRSHLGLKVCLTTPDQHDREVATVQGLTHLIAKLLVQMEPLPTRMTTLSYDLLMRAVGMVRHDTAALFRAIELRNPHASQVRERFFTLAEELEKKLADESAGRP